MSSEQDTVVRQDIDATIMEVPEEPTIELVTLRAELGCTPDCSPCGQSGCRPDSACHPDCTP